MPREISAPQAGEFLRTRGHDAKDLEPLSGGEWSAAFAFREDGRDYVVRFHERRDDLEKDRYAQRWATPALRIGRIVEIGDLDEGAYGISERVIGTPLDELDEAGMRAMLPPLFAAMDGLRDADVSASHGYWGWHGDGNGESPTWREGLLGLPFSVDALARDRAALARSPLGTAEFDAGLERLQELLPACPEERHVIHNDLLNFNVFADAHGVVLLDWGASLYGDFLYDAALLTFWWPWYGKWDAIDIRAELERHHMRAGTRLPRFAERLRCYEVHIGVDHIAYQVGRGRIENARWTARHTVEVANAPL